MFFIDDGADASVVFERDNNDSIYVDGDEDDSDQEPEAWDDSDDINTSGVSYVHTTKEVAPIARGASIFSIPFNKQARSRAQYEKIYPRPDLADDGNSNHDNDKEYLVEAEN